MKPSPHLPPKIYSEKQRYGNLQEKYWDVYHGMQILTSQKHSETLLPEKAPTSKSLATERRIKQQNAGGSAVMMAEFGLRSSEIDLIYK